jgi:alpha-maltose-1-phosphate synthase
MHIVTLTNEYPPNVYGGAGVHVEYLTRELARADGGSHRVDVLSFGEQREDHGNLTVRGVIAPTQIAAGDPRHEKFFDTVVRDLVMAGATPLAADIIHGHTWYSHLAGCLARQLTGGRLVLTTHSLEPHRPWKHEQLGTAYRASSWIERIAYKTADGIIAVSDSMKRDVVALYDVDPDRVRVIPNGIDPEEYRPTFDAALLRRHKIDPERPFVLFVGRITRQKGIIHLVRALPQLDPGTQVVLAAGGPDTPEIAAEMRQAVVEARSAATGPIIWIEEMLPRKDVVQLYSHAAVFVCPSVYEPFGIINLEAMACETPVVASAVGGIPDIIVEGETGLLVPFEAAGDHEAEPRDPARFASDLAEAINTVLRQPDKAAAMGRAGRQRVVDRFSWRAVADQTLEFYRSLLA